jgi:hypothetical protein
VPEPPEASPDRTGGLRPRVPAIAGQPFRLIGAEGAPIPRHVPDILLVTADGSAMVVDVEPLHKRDAPDIEYPDK